MGVRIVKMILMRMVMMRMTTGGRSQGNVVIGEYRIHIPGIQLIPQLKMRIKMKLNWHLNT